MCTFCIDDKQSASPIRILVVEDNIPFRQLICSILAKRAGLQIVGEASDGLEAVRKSEGLQPDLILLDIGLPCLNGIEAARRIRGVAPKSDIVFLSQETSSDVVRGALDLGASAYVVKSNAESDLLAAVEAVIHGKRFVSAGLADKLLTGTK